MLLNKVKITIKKYKLLGKGEKVLLGVSGGPDSLALLFLLEHIRKELNLSLHIAHLDHGLRKGSSLDAKFVKKLARKLGIPVTCKRLNLKKSFPKGAPEEIARNARLRFLFRVAKKIKAKKIALGHTRDDQAETVLMRILRGAGLSGLSGISPQRRIAGFQVIRPLIEVNRNDIEAYLREERIKPRLDATNAQGVYLCNRIRHKLLPLLEREYNQNIKQVLANMAENVTDDYDYLEKVTRQAIDGTHRRVKLSKLLKLHPAIRRLAIRNAIAHIKGDTRSITFQHIREIEDLILNRPINSIVDLPKGISVIKKKTLLFYRS